MHGPEPHDDHIESTAAAYQLSFYLVYQHFVGNVNRWALKNGTVYGKKVGVCWSFWINQIREAAQKLGWSL